MRKLKREREVKIHTMKEVKRRNPKFEEEEEKKKSAIGKC